MTFGQQLAVHQLDKQHILGIAMAEINDEALAALAEQRQRKRAERQQKNAARLAAGETFF
jgi:uncharacterized small protein (DUF1192 family)